jgi:hypothetical protein
VTAVGLLAAVRARTRHLAAWFGLTPPQLCVCGHDESAHKHFRGGSDCGICGVADCARYRPVDLHAVCRDAQLIDAVLADDIDHALLLGPAELVGALVALADTRRRG